MLDEVTEILKLLVQALTLVMVAWTGLNSYRNTKRLKQGMNERKVIADKIDVLTEQTNGMIAELASENRALGASEARREDAAKRS